MELLSLVFLMLVAILASNLINRFLPSISAPIIQIALGALIGLAPLPFHLVLNPEWFFVLFIAPLLFYDGVLANKQALWGLRKSILLLAFGLVFLTVLLIGYLTDLLVPSMPLAAAFALAAAVTPTDAVAVSSLGKRIRIPHGIMHLLEGESLINDASGLVSFQFAVAAMMTGVFSLVDAGVELALVVAGGILVGVVLTVLKIWLVRWVRSLGMEDITFHILIGVLTPFVIYLVAEHLHVSGILAVVASGILHSFEARRLNPETVALRVTSESVWSTVAYVLNGLVFVILGTQMPDILESVRFMAQIDERLVLVDVLVIMLALMIIRFGWAYFTLNHEALSHEEPKMSRLRASAIVSMAGVRGAVTLASTMSLPFLLPSGDPFPFRETIIFIASLVILLSLLVANFLLPLLLKHSASGAEEVDSATIDAAARVAILQQVIGQLGAQTTPENRGATARVVREYYSRINDLQAKRGWSRAERDAEAALRVQTLEWEREHALEYIASNDIDPASVDFLLEILESQSARAGKRWISRSTISHRTSRWLQFVRGQRRVQGGEKARAAQRSTLFAIARKNDRYVIDRLHTLLDEVTNGGQKATNGGQKVPQDLSSRTQLANLPDARVIQKVIDDYKLALSLTEQRALTALHPEGDGARDQQADANPDADANPEAIFATVSAQAFQFERDAIQQMFEEGRISRASAAEMRNNVDLLALRLQKETFLAAT